MATKSLSGGEALESKLKEIAARLKSAGSVDVGFMADKTYPDGTPIAQVAFWNEFGTKRAPPRPFFRGMIAANSPDWGKQLGKIAVDADYDADVALGRMGLLIEGQLVESITQFSDPPNAESTIKKKGFDQPLIDDGTMRNSVGSEVKK